MNAWWQAGGVALAAMIVPAWLLWPGRQPVAVEGEAATLALPVSGPPLRAAYARPLFAATADGSDALPTDAPVVLGIVGRLGRDAVALVRDGAGTRTLAPGDSVDGWQLRSLSIDAAFFGRGGQTARVPLAAD